MVPIAELTPKQVVWYANVSKDQALQDAANEYILNNAELFKENNNEGENENG